MREENRSAQFRAPRRAVRRSGATRGAPMLCGGRWRMLMIARTHGSRYGLLLPAAMRAMTAGQLRVSCDGGKVLSPAVAVSEKAAFLCLQGCRRIHGIGGVLLTEASL